VPLFAQEVLRAARLVKDLDIPGAEHLSKMLEGEYYWLISAGRVATHVTPSVLFAKAINAATRAGAA